MSANKATIPNLTVTSTGPKRSRTQMITGFIDMPCWDGYFLAEGTAYDKEEKRVTGGRIELHVDGRIYPDGSMEFSAPQVNAYHYIVNQSEVIQKVILETLVKEFPRLLADDYEYFDPESGFPPLDEIVPGYNFKNYIGPASLSILELDKDDAAYVTWHFKCRWDPEHGFQAILHKDRVIDIGSDTDIWKIFKDNGTYEQELAAYNSTKHPAPYSWKKKWWQFWKKY